MYKLYKIMLMLLVISSSFVYGETSREESIFIIEKVNQQMEVQLNRQIGGIATKLNANMDANYKNLDERMFNILKLNTRKLIVGLVGGMTVVLIGYGWLVSYITRTYTPLYQRNLLRKKYEHQLKDGKMVIDKDSLEQKGIDDSIIDESEKENREQMEKISPLRIFKKSKVDVNTDPVYTDEFYEGSNAEESSFEYFEETEEKSKLSLGKKLTVGFLVLIIGGIALYFVNVKFFGVGI